MPSDGVPRRTPIGDFLQAPFRSGVSIEDFQLDPLVRAIDMARANLLIADDVGLGKTIEAGLVIQELLLRHRARSVFVVCPASLQEKWRVEMLEKFGLEFRMVNTDYVKELRRARGIHANPWTSFPRLIASVDWIKSGEPLRMLRDILPVRANYPRKFDILVVDEAHNVAPAGSAHYALESQRTQFIRKIAPHFQHRLFLTATPHNGYTESFTSLLELLDDQRFLTQHSARRQATLAGHDQEVEKPIWSTRTAIRFIPSAICRRSPYPSPLTSARCTKFSTRIARVAKGPARTRAHRAPRL